VRLLTDTSTLWECALPQFLSQKGKIKMLCPKCGKQAELKCHAKGLATAAGIVAGASLALRSARIGAVVGSAVFPGPGTVAGSFLGLLAGAAAGGLSGNGVGKLVDENVIRRYYCPKCHHEWRSA